MSKLASKAVARRRAPPARSIPAPRRDAHTEILEAALKVFARDGFDGAALTDIAALAGVGHPLIHYHFGTKEELWKAAIEYAFAGAVEALEKIAIASRDLEPVDALRIMWRAGMRSVAEHPERMAMVFGEARNGSERFAWVSGRYLARIYALLDQTIEAAAAKGQIKPIAPAHLTSLLVGASFAFFAMAPVVGHFYKLDARRPDNIERHIDSVVEVVMNGMRC